MQEVKEVIMRLVKKASEKVDNNMKRGVWDSEELEVLKDSVKIWKDIEKIEDIEENHDIRKEIREIESVRAEREGSEFKDLVYDLYKSNPDFSSINKIIDVLDETMGELKIIHEKVYDNTMKKLKHKNNKKSL